MKKTYMLMLIMTLPGIIPNVRGQSIGPSTLNASGGSGTIGSTKFDWSVGEMTMVSTFTGSSVIVTQGVLQNDISSSSVGSISLNEHLQVFPNPASTLVNLQLNSDKEGTLQYTLLDMTGKRITDRKTAIKQGTNTEQMDISNLAAAVYMLEVSFTSASGTASSSYKIDKLK